jgi:hypothetical protein
MKDDAEWVAEALDGGLEAFAVICMICLIDRFTHHAPSWTN